MANLTDEGGDILRDEVGNPLTDNGGGDIIVGGSDLIVFTTMMSFLLMIFGNALVKITDAINNLAAKIP